ncbi:MAG: lysophospholipid acyltransferase family protein [Planctomycetaceae bacterium]
MTESIAIVVLVSYLLATVGVVAWRVKRYEVDWLAWSLYCVQRLFTGWMWRWRSNCRCPFPSDSAALIIANHSSATDPMQLWMNHHLGSGRRNIRTISFLMAREYYDLPGFRWIFQSMRAIPVDRNGRDTAPLRKALRLLQRGHLVGVFPEGGINISGEGLMEGSGGVAWLALKARLPVYPVFLHGVPGGADMVGPFLLRSHVRVSYGDPIDLSMFYGQRSSRELLSEVTKVLMAGLADLGGVERPGGDTDDLQRATIPVTDAVRQAAVS